MMLGLTVWILVAAATVLGAVTVAVADGRRRRAGLWTVVLGSGGLLLLLGVDVAALAWLGLGAPMVLLSDLCERMQPADDRPRPVAGVWGRRLAAAAPALLLGGVLVSAVLAVDWQGRPPPSAPVVAGAEVGGRLLVADLALLAGCGLLVMAVLAAAAAAIGGPSRDDRKGS
jgi:hypothetical protein